MVGRVFLSYILFAILPGKIFPILKNQEIQLVMTGIGSLVAIYPYVKKLGYGYKDVCEYFSGITTEFKPALKYWVVLMCLLYVSDAIIAIALAAIDLPWSNMLLFWNDQTHNPAIADSFITALRASPARIPLFLLALCIFSPLIEEFIMRRGLYVAMRKKLPFAAAVFLNGALFGLLHGKDFLDPMLIGFFMCFAYEKGKKLSTVILIHAYMNLFVSLNIFSDKLFGFSL